ncbi:MULTISPECIES: P-loop NTPase fold protein [unclassified Anabaena]|uniref:P-loop NTPase fold protein n=1 Tax=unclassified Anabaena TaxID=2619674 RepID=UPI0039C64988
MKLQELKTKVYELAKVNTTKQLKTKYKEIQTLDMRLKTSWQDTLAIIQKSQSEYEEWVKNPPEEYKELFSEITEALEIYDQKSVQTKKLAQKIVLIADDLEELAEEFQTEAEQIKQEVEVNKRISKKARFN